MYPNSIRLPIVLVLLAGVALLVPSGATPFLSSGPTDSVGEHVQLQPTQGPGGYVSYLEDGELVVDVSGSNPSMDIEGVNPNTVTRLENVFLVHYNGSQQARVWLTHDGDGLTFTAEGHPIESEDDAITLGPNESAVVDLIVDTRGDSSVENVDDFTVHAVAANSSSEETDGTLPGDWWSSSDGKTQEPAGEDSDGDSDEESDEITTTEATTSDTESPESSPSDTTTDDLGGVGGEETTTVATPDTTTAPKGPSLTSVLFGQRAGVLPGAALGMGLLALLVAVAIVLGRRYSSE